MKRLCLLLVLFVGLLLLWFSPLTHDYCEATDKFLFRLLNSPLENNTALQYIFAILNHKLETKLNLVAMIGINIYCVFQYPRGQKLKIFLTILFFWAFFQFGLGLHDLYFEDYLAVRRASPSIVMDNPVLLSKIFNNNLIKDSCSCCFPSGHALALTYWLGFSVAYMSKLMRQLAVPVLVFFLFPRAVTGAHWVSDIIFSGMLALIWLEVAKLTLKFRKVSDTFWKLAFNNA